MKTPTRIFLTLILAWGLLPAAGDPDVSRYMRGLDLLTVPFSAQRTALHAGLAYGSGGQILPQLGLTVPFGGAYSFSGSLGASQDAVFGSTLTLFGLGIGTRGEFARDPRWGYALSGAVRNYRTSQSNNLTVGVEFMAERSLGRFLLAAGLDLGIQHHQVDADAPLTASDERAYTLVPQLALYSPYGNIALRAGRDIVALALSWTLHLE